MQDYSSQGMNAFLLTVLLIIWLRPVMVRCGLVDRPNARKLHDGAVPAYGGIAIFLAFVGAHFSLQKLGIPLLAFAGFATITTCGAIDDRWDLPALPRLVVEGLVAILLISATGGGSIHLASSLPGDLAPLALALAPMIAGVFVIGTINAINMLDGVDGLAGGCLAIAFFWLALIAHWLGHAAIAQDALILMCAVLGFLVFNLRHPWRNKAIIYLGDAGSMLLGAAAAYFIIELSSGPSRVAFPLLLWIVIVPVTDTLILIVSRMAAGRSPMSADRRHLHHLFLGLGLSQASAAALIIAISAACGAVAYAGLIFKLPDAVMLVGLLVPMLIHAGFVIRATGGLDRIHRDAIPPLMRTAERPRDSNTRRKS